MNSEQLKQLEKDLWSAADNLRANSDLKSTEYATPVLGLIFLKFADNKYSQAEAKITAEYENLKGSRREKPIYEIAEEICGFYLPEHARFDYLLNLPEQETISKKIKEAMQAIEDHKGSLDGVLPKDEYSRIENPLLAQLLKTFSNIPRDASGDILGKIYEYFLGKFALAEGQGGGEFFTPTSVVKLIVEMIEPYEGTVYDPACGTGGMFVQSQQFVDRNRAQQSTDDAMAAVSPLTVYGQEKTLETVKLAKMNLAVNGLRGEVVQTNSYASDPHKSLGRFDFVMANPPFNVDEVPVATVEGDERFNTYGIPRKKTKAKKGEEGKETVPNANYLWINLFATSLSEKGRAGLVMPNSASDARHSEADIRETLIKENLIYGMVSLPSNLFYTVTLPATLWFFDKAKEDNNILFIDARNIFTQISRALREFNEAQIQNIALISKLHKGNRQAFVTLIDEYFDKGIAQLKENKTQVKPVSEQLTAVLDDEQGKTAVADLVKDWEAFDTLTKAITAYRKKNYRNAYKEDEADNKAITQHNTAQHKLREQFDPFFKALHQGLKQLDKIVRQHEKTKAEEKQAEGKRTTTDKATKDLKTALEQLHNEVKNAEGYFKHIHWLQERFPKAEYEDVTGLCKLATLDEVEEQDYSLNPGRYVGVVIEEDGKTEEEFITEIASLNTELKTLSHDSTSLTEIIHSNIADLLGDTE